MEGRSDRVCPSSSRSGRWTLVSAGTNLVGPRDKQCKELFRARLSYPVSDRYKNADSSDEPPFGASFVTSALGPEALENLAVEASGHALFLFDQGVLTAFSLPDGAVRWRLPSVGVNHVQFDNAGMLYVDSTTATPEDIQYSDQIKFQSIYPVILKIDPTKGKILCANSQHRANDLSFGQICLRRQRRRGRGWNCRSVG